MEIRHIDWLPAPGVNTQGVVAALVRQAQQPQSSLGTVYSADGVTRYTYDPTGQLVAAQYSACATGSASAVLPDETYTYDANGNRAMPGYVIGTGNRLLSDGTYQYAYDAEGNRTARFIDANLNGLLDEGDNTITVYGWDGRNRLATVTTYATYGGAATQIVGYRYDTQNRWIGETIDSDGDGTIDHATRFVYDSHQIALQFDRASATGSASVLTASDLSHRYLWGPAVDQLLSDERTQLDGNGNLATDDLLWALGDQLGTVRDLAIYDAVTGLTSVVNHRDFDSFGNLKAQSDAALDCLIGFTGLPFDAGSGTYRTPTRPYDPVTGRWLQPDWIDIEGRDTNLYRYCGNEPITTVDPSGLMSPAESSRLLSWSTGGLNPTATRPVTLKLDLLKTLNHKEECDKYVDTLVQEATRAVMRAQTEIDRLYEKLRDHPSGNLVKARQCLSQTELVLLKRMEQTFATPLPAVDGLSRYPGTLGWEDLWSIVETVDKMAKGCSRLPCTVTIRQYDDGHLAPEGNVAGSTHGFRAAIWGVDGRIYIYKPFWDKTAPSQAAYLIHEFAHVYADCEDVAYLLDPNLAGFAAETEISKYLKSDEAVRNADSYRVFFQQVYLSNLRLRLPQIT